MDWDVGWDVGCFEVDCPAIGLSLFVAARDSFVVSGSETIVGAFGRPIVGLVMGSRSDWDTMSAAAVILEEFGVAFEAKVISAHRTPRLLTEYAETAEVRGIEVVIAGAGGAAHLPGMLAAQTIVPVFGVPVQSKALSGMDSLLSIVQMPRGIPVGTLAIGAAGAANAALLAIAVISTSRPDLRDRLRAWRLTQTADVLARPDPRT